MTTELREERQSDRHRTTGANSVVTPRRTSTSPGKGRIEEKDPALLAAQ